MSNRFTRSVIVLLLVSSIATSALAKKKDEKESKEPNKGSVPAVVSQSPYGNRGANGQFVPKAERDKNGRQHDTATGQYLSRDASDAAVKRERDRAEATRRSEEARRAQQIQSQTQSQIDARAKAIEDKRREAQSKAALEASRQKEVAEKEKRHQQTEEQLKRNAAQKRIEHSGLTPEQKREAQAHSEAANRERQSRLAIESNQKQADITTRLAQEQSERDRRANALKAQTEANRKAQQEQIKERQRQASQTGGRGNSGNGSTKRPVPKPDDLFRNSNGQLVNRNTGLTEKDYRISRKGNIVDQKTGKLVSPAELTKTKSHRDLIERSRSFKAQGSSLEHVRRHQHNYTSSHTTQINIRYNTYINVYERRELYLPRYRQYSGFRGGYYYPVVPYTEIHTHFDNPLINWMFNDYDYDFHTSYYSSYGVYYAPARFSHVRTYYPTLALTNLILDLSSRVYHNPSHHYHFSNVMNKLTQSIIDQTRLSHIDENDIVVNHYEILPDGRHAVIEGFVETQDRSWPYSKQNWGFKSLVSLYNDFRPSFWDSSSYYVKTFVLDNRDNEPSITDMRTLTEINSQIVQWGGDWENPYNEADEIGDEAQDQE